MLSYLVLVLVLFVFLYYSFKTTLGDAEKCAWRWGRVHRGYATPRWDTGQAAKQLALDGVVIVEPWVDIVCELSGLFQHGEWLGLTEPIVQGGAWRGHKLNDACFVTNRQPSFSSSGASGRTAACGRTDAVGATTTAASTGNTIAESDSAQPLTDETRKWKEVREFVLGDGGRVQRILCSLPGLPKTCGIDCAVIRNKEGELDLRLFELNARYTFGE